MELREASPFAWHLLSGLIVILLGGALLSVPLRRWQPEERRLVGLAFAAHVSASYALLWVIQTIYGVGDVISFFRQGELLVRYVNTGTPGALGDITALVFQQSVHFPFLVIGIESPTGSMSGVGALLLLLTGSMWTGNLIAGLFAFSGQLAIYATFRESFSPHLRRRLAIAALLVPSVAFWSGGLVKEAVAIGGLGWLIFGLWRVSQRKLVGVASVIGGGLVIGLSKPYIFVPLVLAVGVWLYWRKGLERGEGDFQSRPWRLLVAGTVAGAGVVLIGQLFPSYSMENLGEQAALHQFHGSRAGGGSAYDVGNPWTERTLIGQLAFAPMGLISAWFRPFIFEVSNAAMVVNALESTAVTLLAGRVLMRLGPAGVWAKLRGSPALMFCLAFSVLTGIGVGITSTNLGTLSRYRGPMMPFFLALLLTLDAAANQKGTAAPVTSSKKASQRSTIRSSA